MKNILLIITLLISWNAIAEEKTWFCSTEESGGLIYENNSWKVTQYKDKRMTVKQQDNILSFSNPTFENTKCNMESWSLQRLGVITCQNAYMASFALNTNTGLATSSQAFGWIGSEGGDNEHDTLIVSAWKCESF
jgi:nitrogen fixation protein FixH